MFSVLEAARKRADADMFANYAALVEIAMVPSQKLDYALKLREHYTQRKNLELGEKTEGPKALPWDVATAFMERAEQLMRKVQGHG